jgi:hypothetical protein
MASMAMLEFSATATEAPGVAWRVSHSDSVGEFAASCFERHECASEWFGNVNLSNSRDKVQHPRFLFRQIKVLCDRWIRTDCSSDIVAPYARAIKIIGSGIVRKEQSVALSVEGRCYVNPRRSVFRIVDRVMLGLQINTWPLPD